MLHFGKIPNFFGQNLAKIRQIWQNLQDFAKKNNNKFSNFQRKNVKETESADVRAKGKRGEGEILSVAMNRCARERRGPGTCTRNLSKISCRDLSQICCTKSIADLLKSGQISCRDLAQIRCTKSIAE